VWEVVKIGKDILSLVKHNICACVLWTDGKPKKKEKNKHPKWILLMIRTNKVKINRTKIISLHSHHTTRHPLFFGLSMDVNINIQGSQPNGIRELRYLPRKTPLPPHTPHKHMALVQSKPITCAFDGHTFF